MFWHQVKQADKLASRGSAAHQRQKFLQPIFCQKTTEILNPHFAIFLSDASRIQDEPAHAVRGFLFRKNSVQFLIRSFLNPGRTGARRSWLFGVIFCQKLLESRTNRRTPFVGFRSYFLSEASWIQDEPAHAVRGFSIYWLIGTLTNNNIVYISVALPTASHRIA